LLRTHSSTTWRTQSTSHGSRSSPDGQGRKGRRPEQSNAASREICGAEISRPLRLENRVRSKTVLLSGMAATVARSVAGSVLAAVLVLPACESGDTPARDQPPCIPPRVIAGVHLTSATAFLERDCRMAARRLSFAVPCPGLIPLTLMQRVHPSNPSGSPLCVR
jgi:hypothetical protein